MGLDQCAGIVTGKDEDGELEIEDIATWRKHPNLHGWMENLWRERGLSETGEWNEFNSGVYLELTLVDINRLEWEIREKNLPETEGFFFGNDADDEYKEEDLSFCKQARELIKKGKTIVYTSWW
tara:strand:- start:785 stop:1156 length:372 start_codon:yes stop_codon:yes gene_type:complete